MAAVDPFAEAPAEPQKAVDPFAADTPGPASPRPGIVKSFWNDISEKSPLELWKTESIPAHIGQGLARQDYINDKVNDKYNALPNKPASLQDRMHLRHQIKNEIENQYSQSMGEAKGQPAPSMADIYQAAKSDLGKFAGEIFKSVETDPWLLFGGEMGIATRAVNAVNKVSKIAKVGTAVQSAARVGARVAGTATEGAAISAGISAADQFAKGDGSLERTKSDAVNGGILMSLMGLKRLGHDIEFGKGAANAKITPESMDRILGENPKATPQDVEKVYGEFKSKMPDVPLKPWDTAYNLINGKLKGQEKLAAQKDPEVWKALDSIQKERQARAQAFQGENPKTMDERLTKLKDRADKLKEIQKDQAWDARNAFDNETPSIEESFKRMADFQRQRSIDEKISDLLHTDTEGFELPSQSGGPRAARMQEGKADVKLLGAVGLTLGGALAGAYFAGDNEKIEGFALGGLAGIGAMNAGRIINAMRTNWKSVAAGTATTTGGIALGTYLDKDHPVEGALLGALLFGASKMLPKARALSTDEFIKIRNGTVAARDRQINSLKLAIEQAIPDKARREAISQQIETGNLAGLSKDELRAVNAYRQMTTDYAAMGKQAGVLEGFLQDYVTHIVEKNGIGATQAQKILNDLFGDSGTIAGTGTSTKTPFAKARKYATFGELNKALQGTGLRIKTMDLAEIAHDYAHSMHRAIENRRLIDNMKAAKDAGGWNYLMDAKTAPPGYQAGFSHPQLLGMAAHPDLVPSLKFVFDNNQPDMITRGLLATNMAVKRLNVTASMFHAKSLTDAYIAANGWRAIRAGHDIKAALNMYRNGGAGDVVDTALRNGLRIEIPEDVTVNILSQIGALADHMTERATGLNTRGAFEKGLSIPESLQKRYFDRVTWDVMHTGMKLSTFMSTYEKALMKNPKADPNVIAANVASYVNDTFGGLDWFRAAQESTTQLGRNLSMAMFAPSGRRRMQAWMFAPDWTFSTFRAAWKAIPGNTNSALTRELHQKYVARSALVYLTAINAINVTMSGHNIWENQDPTRLDRGDGTTQQVTKHAMEPYEWMLKPRQMALNKLGFVPKTAFEIFTDKDYLSAESQAPKIEGSKISHVLKSVSPIGFQQGFSGYKDSAGSPGRALSGFLGVPIYGQTTEEKEKAKIKKRIEKAIKGP